ncbi:MAG: hypothetical protein R3E64_12995 [Halioglobus sp.]
MKTFFAFILLAVVTACSHPLEIVGEGDIMSASGDRFCWLEDFQSGQDICVKNYVVGAYLETYYAVPRAGWEFDHWENYCTDAVNNECSFDISSAAVRKFWGQTMPPLQAVFTFVAPVDTDGDGLNDDVDPCPQNPTNPCALITDTIAVGSMKWVQPRLFLNLSWYEIDAVCPASSGGRCENVTLKGYDMNGWTWASLDDVNALFNYFLNAADVSEPDLLVGPDYYQQADSGWAPAFFDSGFLPTVNGDISYLTLYGWTSTLYSPSYAWIGNIGDFSNPEYPDHVSSNSVTGLSEIGIYDGAFFYRSIE